MCLWYDNLIEESLIFPIVYWWHSKSTSLQWHVSPFASSIFAHSCIFFTHKHKSLLFIIYHQKSHFLDFIPCWIYLEDMCIIKLFTLGLNLDVFVSPHYDKPFLWPWLLTQSVMTDFKSASHHYHDVIRFHYILEVSVKCCITGVLLKAFLPDIVALKHQTTSNMTC